MAALLGRSDLVLDLCLSRFTLPLRNPRADLPNSKVLGSHPLMVSSCIGCPRKLLEPSIVLFLKGNRTTPKCKFSRAMLEILDKENIEFEPVNVLADDDVREGLKKHSNWPTYPQLYSNGDLVGGVDVVRELHETGKLREELGLTEVNLDDRLRELINQEKVMLFMKGNPQAPRCGFSTKIVDVLNENGIKYGSFDILSDDDVRQGLKKLSNWPTYPQLYSKGELIGGLDIVKELEEMGELVSELG